MPSEIPPITFGTFFHIYNRGNNGENIFIQERNYAYFMELWWKHTHQIFETWAYGLLKNHFHIAGFVKTKEDLSGMKLKEPSQYFSNCFNAYSRGVNLAVGRTAPCSSGPSKESLLRVKHI